MRITIFGLSILLCSCATKTPLAVEAIGSGSECNVVINGVSTRLDALDKARLRALAAGHGRRMIIDTDDNTPYRCLGAVIIELQRWGYRWVAVTVNDVPIRAE
jgi:hypothetical protein